MTPGEESIRRRPLSLTKIGEDELMDTDVAALKLIITDSFSRAIAEAEDTAFVVGTGHATKQPEGILNSS